MKHVTGCPQAAFVVCPVLLLRETKSYEETEETGHLQTQKPHLITNMTYKSPAEGARTTRIQIICGSKTRESSYQMVVTLCQVISCDHDFH